MQTAMHAYCHVPIIIVDANSLWLQVHLDVKSRSADMCVQWIRLPQKFPQPNSLSKYHYIAILYSLELNLWTVIMDILPKRIVLDIWAVHNKYLAVKFCTCMFHYIISYIAGYRLFCGIYNIVNYESSCIIKISGSAKANNCVI